MMIPRATLLLLAILTVFRFVYIAVVPPSPHDAYIWLCAAHLDQAFFDAPAGLPFLTHGLLSIFGDTPFVLRAASPLFALLASLAIGRLARELMGENAAGPTILLLNLVPSFNVASVSADPTCLALFLAAAGSILLWRSLHGSTSPVPPAMGAGAIAAIGLTVSYAFGIVLVAWGVAALCQSRKSRRQNLVSFAWIALISLIGLTSPLLWNVAHNWPLLGDWTLKRALSIDRAALPGGITSWTIAASPLLLAAMIAFVPGLIGEARAHPRYRFPTCLGLVPLAATAAAVLVGAEFPATLWTIAAAFLLIPLVARVSRTPPGWWPIAAVAAATSLIVLLALRIDAARWEALSVLTTHIHSDQQMKKEEPLFLIAWDADAVAMLSYPTPQSPFGRPPEVHRLECQAIVDQFGLWPSYDDFIDAAKPPDDFFVEQHAVNPYVGKSALYIGPEPPDALPQAITAGFAEVVPLCTIPGSPAKRGTQLLNVYYCRSYQTLPL